MNRFPINYVVSRHTVACQAKFKLTILASSTVCNITWTIWNHFGLPRNSEIISLKPVKFYTYIQTCEMYMCSIFYKHKSNYCLDINVQKTLFLLLTVLESYLASRKRVVWIQLYPKLIKLVIVLLNKNYVFGNLTANKYLLIISELT